MAQQDRHTTPLEAWVQEAAAHLSAASAARMRQEITEHFQAAYEEAESEGLDPDAAQRRALAALGDARNVNRRYREVTLTGSEDRLLRKVQAETSFVCAYGTKLWILSVATFGAAIWCLATGRVQAMWPILLLAIGMSLVAVPFLLPVNTLVRSRIFRGVRWAWLIGVCVWAFGPNYRSNSWLMLTCAWPIVWREWKVSTVRRKLPVSEWPRQLFL
jgi:hypothetical protein